MRIDAVSFIGVLVLGLICAGMPGCHPGGSNGDDSAPPVVDPPDPPPPGPPPPEPDPDPTTVSLWVNGVAQTPDVGDGAELQALLDGAAAGDVIELEAGTVITRAYPLMLPAGLSDWVTVQTRGGDAVVPAGRRVTRADAPRLAEIRTTSPGVATLQTRVGAAFIRLKCLRLRTLVEGVTNWPCVWIGGGNTSSTTLCHDIELDRILMDVDDLATPDLMYHQICLFGKRLTLKNSHVSGVRSVSDGDYGAVWIGYGDGPIDLENNFLEAGGECVFIGYGNFGGGDTVVPSDITLRGNVITRNLAWRDVYVTKNLLEIKSGKRVLLDGNIFSNAWAHAQVPAIVITLRSEIHAPGATPSEPASEIADITIVNNVVKGASQAIALMAWDASGYGDQGLAGAGLGPASNLLVHNNLFIDIDPVAWGGGYYTWGRVLEGWRGMTFTHNTIDTDQAYGFQHAVVLGDELTWITGFDFRNNIVTRSDVCFFGGHIEGLDASCSDTPNVRANVFGGDVAPHGVWQPLNTFTGTQAEVLGHFASPRTPTWNYELLPSSAYRGAAVDAAGAPTGRDLGCNFVDLYDALGSSNWRSLFPWLPPGR